MNAPQQACVIYTRQSRTSSGEFSSCEAQFLDCLQWITSWERRGLVWAGKHYADAGESSDTLERPGLQHLLADLASGQVQRVVVQRLDRLSRRVLDCILLVEKFHQLKVELTVLDLPDLDGSANSRFLLNLLAAVAEFERSIIRDRLTEARHWLKSQGRRVAGVIPYGYRTDHAKQLVFDPEESRRVFAMFHSADQGKRPRHIAEVANALGWRTRSHKPDDEDSGHWTPRQVLETLSNPVYAGWIHAGKDLRRGCHPAIVDQRLFDRVGEMIGSRRTFAPTRPRRRRVWALQGRLHCGSCGRLMNPSQSHHGPKVYRYYRCRSHSGGLAPCVGMSISAYKVERLVIGAIDDLFAESTNPELQRANDTWGRLDDYARELVLPKLVKKAVLAFEATGRSGGVDLEIRIDDSFVDQAARDVQVRSGAER